jgi:hypothetical protein
MNPNFIKVIPAVLYLLAISRNVSTLALKHVMRQSNVGLRNYFSYSNIQNFEFRVYGSFGTDDQVNDRVYEVIENQLSILQACTNFSTAAVYIYSYDETARLFYQYQHQYTTKTFEENIVNSDFTIMWPQSFSRGQDQLFNALSIKPSNVIKLPINDRNLELGQLFIHHNSQSFWDENPHFLTICTSSCKVIGAILTQELNRSLYYASKLKEMGSEISNIVFTTRTMLFLLSNRLQPNDEIGLESINNIICQLESIEQCLESYDMLLSNGNQMNDEHDDFFDGIE